jgi:putative membrane protein
MVMGHMMNFWGGGAIMWVLLLIIIGILVYFLAQNLSSGASVGTSKDTPLEILKKRYARGEITKDEFEEMKRSL